jgi:hypothetical protein
MNFQGELRRGGRVVLERVAGTVSGEPQADGSTAWSGAFLLPPRQRLWGGDHTLYLDDGTSPVIRLISVAAGDSLPALVSFNVSGPVP